MATPDLELLIGAYYHQDFETVWGALDHYLANSTSAECAGVVHDIEQVLAAYPTDDEVDRYLDTLGNAADRSNEPGGYRGWLEEIARRVRAHLGER